ncbi:hypothetical protein BDB01DRAFT_839691 [Pilobolus umbonatus]|nr:hypothetical protein BDB01DRAFT_839691 [Pilobolus umbonatus]
MFKFIASSLLAIVALSLPAPSGPISFSLPGDYPSSSEECSQSVGSSVSISSVCGEIECVSSGVSSASAASGSSVSAACGSSVSVGVSPACGIPHSSISVDAPACSSGFGLTFSAPSLPSSPDSGSFILEDCIGIPEERVAAPTQSKDTNTFFLDRDQYPPSSRKRRREDDNEYDDNDDSFVPVDYDSYILHVFIVIILFSLVDITAHPSQPSHFY